MRRWRELAAVALILVIGGAASLYGYWRWQFPYGWSHSCDSGLRMQLTIYADQHDGWFPRGETSPEASLSLLHREFPGVDLTEMLRGKTAPLEAVQTRLNRGELLDPETCGWHYVEGLRKTDNPNLALFWDKAGLGHNGQRLKAGGHVVWFVGFRKEYITAAEWARFLAEQEQLQNDIFSRRSPESVADGTR